ncbi:MAG TPA: EF-hand domain-containing protein [Burkholderiales bacterium]|jgi:hypothetical protein|nr:EF-hand domain-containing protein [Burkholderiales bacterium]HEX2650481.1 EF-hand domain-containing protein [Burkholderiales bacterium]
MTTHRVLQAAVATAAALLSAAAVPALAGEAATTAGPPSPYAVTFEQLDSNRDGKLSFSEAFANPTLSNNFNLIDSNADGFLSLAEIRAAIGGSVFGG